MFNVDDIRSDNVYGGMKATINAVFGKIKENIKVDITTGDIITTRAICFKYKMMFEDKNINILTYNLTITFT